MAKTMEAPDLGYGRVRVVFRMAIGIEPRRIVPSVLRDALFALDDALTRITGGIVRLDGSGTWTADSEDRTFCGPVERNATFTYLLSVTPNQELKALADIRQATSSVIGRHGLPVTHIHLERSLAEACHFKVHKQGAES